MIQLETRFSSRRQGCERRHTHDYLVLAAVTGGSLFLEIDSRTYELTPGSIGIIPQNTLHRTISFSLDFAGVRTLSIVGTSPEPYQLRPGVVTDCPQDYKTFHNLLDTLPYRAGTETSRIAPLLSHLCKLQPQTPRLSQANSWCATQIKKRLDTRDGATASIHTLTGDLPYSREHCNRLFKRQFNVTIQGYQLNRKAETARQLLYSELPLAEVAIEAGFYDQSQMTRVFRSIFQLTPARYREQILDSASV